MNRMPRHELEDLAAHAAIQHNNVVRRTLALVDHPADRKELQVRLAAAAIAGVVAIPMMHPGFKGGDPVAMMIDYLDNLKRDICNNPHMLNEALGVALAQ